MGAHSLRLIAIVGLAVACTAGPTRAVGPADAVLPPGGFDGDPATTERTAATDPVSLAVEVSRARSTGGEAEHVVLARDDAFADALAWETGGSPIPRAAV